MTLVSEDRLERAFKALYFGVQVRENTAVIIQHIEAQANIIDGFLALFMATLPESAKAVQNLDSTPSTRALFQYLSIVFPN